MRKINNTMKLIIVITATLIRLVRRFGSSLMMITAMMILPKNDKN